jgi:hypothetical protein
MAVAARQPRTSSRLDDAVLDVMTAAWIARCLWRMLRNRPPWRAAR